MLTSVRALMVIMTLPHLGQVTNGETARVKHRHWEGYWYTHKSNYHLWS